MKILVAVVALSLLAGCGKKPTAKDKKEDSGAGGVGVVTAPLDYLGAQGRAKQTAIKVTSLAEVTQAIQKFNAMEDRYPRDLNELVQQHYLGSIPPAPRGTQLAYDPKTGDVRFVRAAPDQPGAPTTPVQKLPGGRPLPSLPPQ
ncbi:MAG TPA: hypothetical protein PLX89_07970 [Verrucomicrobiota bacterium]|nr:hypothetical protein [Verrucomicrobiales bacterium]HRI12925.1 hypothetical protein [Verrucomicrobiota bacterium]